MSYYTFRKGGWPVLEEESDLLDWEHRIPTEVCDTEEEAVLVLEAYLRKARAAALYN